MEPLNIHFLIFLTFFEELRAVTGNLPSLNYLCLTWDLCFAFLRKENYVESVVIKLSSMRYQVLWIIYTGSLNTNLLMEKPFLSLPSRYVRVGVNRSLTTWNTMRVREFLQIISVWRHTIKTNVISGTVLQAFLWSCLLLSLVNIELLQKPRYILPQTSF